MRDAHSFHSSSGSGAHVYLSHVIIITVRIWMLVALCIDLLHDHEKRNWNGGGFSRTSSLWRCDDAIERRNVTHA